MFVVYLKFEFSRVITSFRLAGKVHLVFYFYRADRQSQVFTEESHIVQHVHSTSVTRVEGVLGAVMVGEEAELKRNYNTWYAYLGVGINCN